MQLLMGVQYVAMSADSLVKEAAQGHVDSVRRILSEHPTQVSDLTAAKFVFLLLRSCEHTISMTYRYRNTKKTYFALFTLECNCQE